jgi:hypothetical protein
MAVDYNKPTIDQTRQAAIDQIRENFQGIDARFLALGGGGYLPLTGGTMSGNINFPAAVGAGGIGSYWVNPTGGAGGTPAIRWAVATDGQPEGGSEAGNDLRFYRYNDAGALIGDAIIFKRNTGVLVSRNGIQILGAGLLAASATAVDASAPSSQIVAQGSAPAANAQMAWVTATSSVIARLADGGTTIFWGGPQWSSHRAASYQTTEQVFNGTGVVTIEPKNGAQWAVNVSGPWSVTFASTPNPNVIYRMRVRGTNLGAFTASANMVFPGYAIGVAPDLAAGARKEAVISFWWDAQSSIFHCNAAIY